MKKKILLVLVLALGLTAEVAKADFTFGTPTNLGPTVNSSARDFNASISADGLSLFFISNRPGGVGGLDIWVTTRETTDDPWGTPVNLGPTINSPVGEWGVSISSDDLSLYFDTSQSGSSAINDLWVATRATTDDDWGNPVNLGPTVNTSADDWDPSISADGLELYFTSTRPGGYGFEDIYVTTRATTEDDWGTPVNLGPTVNSSSWEHCPSISADGRMLFFSFGTPGGVGEIDIWVTTRETTDDPWGTPVNLGPTVNSSGQQAVPNISADGSILYFTANRSGGFGGDDLWQVSILPVVDFNGDGIVDIHDLLILIEHWGTDEPLCDIGPMPWGDGIVDVQDLEVLMSYWQQEVLPVELVAYWKLDETEGEIAYDSVGVNDGILNGVPTWQPTSGIIDGALELDGIDDYVSTEFVLNPADSPFSVFAWVKGGAPGQAVLSQIGGVNWLCADPLEGNLMTELKTTGRGAAALLSQTIITDGDWHRIGLVWDGSHRTLYVDDVAVAEDEQTDLGGSENGLYIGAGMAMEPGTYWFGLIDDVRIYNRAVRP